MEARTSSATRPRCSSEASSIRLGILNLVSFIEDEWGVTVEDEELIPEHFGTISRIAQLIESKAPVHR